MGWTGTKIESKILLKILYVHNKLNEPIVFCSDYFQWLTPGFQKSSANTTRSAECRVRPMLAAVMDSTATQVLVEYWNFSHSCCRSADGVVPSIRM